MTTPEDTPRDAVPADGTFRLRPQQHPAPPPPDTATVQLGGGGGGDAGSGGYRPTQRVFGAPMPAYEAPPTVSVPAPPPGEQPEPESLIRFGPGVPDPKTARTMAVWKGEAPAGVPAGAAGEGKPKRRTLGGLLLAGIVLLAVVAVLLWQHFGSSLSISSVTVRAATPALACDGTEQLTATVRTNGSSGTIHYRWVRSDGTNSGPLAQSVPSGTHEAQLPLRWTVQGQGNLQATATVEITAPGTRSASARFDYSCLK